MTAKNNFVNKQLSSGELIMDKAHAYAMGVENGFTVALRAFGIWKGGKQVIGCLDKPVEEVIENLSPLWECHFKKGERT